MKKANLRLRNKLFYVLVMFVLGTLVYIFSSYKCNEYEKEYAEKFSQLAIEKQDYPKRFTLNHNLQNLIENIVVLNNEFNEATVCDEELQKYFIDRYLKNTEISCDYMLENYEKTGELTRQQVEYIQWSMTGKYVSFENIACDLVNIRETSSGWSHGILEEYKDETVGNTVKLNGLVKVKTTGFLGDTDYAFEAKLEANPYSCFDGYSIKSISIKDVTPVIKPDYKVHEVVGSLIEENITDGKVLIEVYDSKDNLSYDHCITLNLLSNEELQKLVLENKDKEWVIRYVLDKEQGACITEITPIDIELKSEKKEIFVQSHVYSYVLYEDLNNNGKLDNGEDANDGGAQTSCAYYDNDKLISETKYNEAEKYMNESALEKGDLGLYNYAEVITYLEKLSK